MIHEFEGADLLGSKLGALPCEAELVVLASLLGVSGLYAAIRLSSGALEVEGVTFLIICRDFNIFSDGGICIYIKHLARLGSCAVLVISDVKGISV